MVEGMDAPDASDTRDGFDADSLWRAQNPGASAARGVLWALLLSAPIWAAVALAIWLILRTG